MTNETESMWKSKRMPAQKVVWADIDDADLICEICGERETFSPYCVSCVNKHLTVMSMFQPTAWDYSESAKTRVYEVICEEHRAALKAATESS